jgi:signal transduction histidine kinase/CheY-like chemotaxis protein
LTHSARGHSFAASVDRQAMSKSGLLGYGVAAAAVAFATVVKLALDPALGHESPFMLFVAAVVVSGWFGGVGPVMLATVGSIVVASWLFMPPHFSLGVSDPGDRVQLLVFVLEAALIGLLAAAFQAVRHRDERTRRALQAEVEERTRLYHDSEIRRRAAESVGELSRQLSQSLDVDAVVREIVRSVGTLLDVKAALVFTLDPGSGNLVARAGSGDVEARLNPPVVFPPGTSLAGLAVTGRRPIVSADALNDPRFPADPGAVERFAASSDRSILALPLMVQDRVIGVLSLRDRTGRVFSEAEIQVAQAFADRAATALENARLYVTAERRRREAEALARAARTLTESLDVDGLAARIVASLQEILRVRTAGFRLLQPNGTLVALGPPGGAPGYAEPGHVALTGFGTSGHAIATGAPFQSADVLVDPRVMLDEEVRRRILAAGTRAYLSVPLRAHGVLIGVLTVGDVAGRVYTAEEIDLLQAFADQAALALDNAQLFERAQRANDELARAHAQLVRGETLRAVGELAAGASHHLNNLLAVILGRIQIALRRSAAPELARDLHPAERAALDGADVVKRLARFGRGSPEPTIVAVDLNELVQDVVEMTRPRWQDEAEARDVRVETRLELGMIPPVAADPPSVREVLVNLILNAVDALPAGGRIAIRTWMTDAGVHCSVADTGIGMSTDVLRRVFEPFFTTKGVKSTGLGLSVNYGIIQRHGGELTVDTAEGRGTTVTFRLPVATAGLRREVPAVDSAPAPLRVLLIDDDAAVRDVVADMLSEDGHTVAQAASGPDGLALLATLPRVDLVLTDLGMLGMNGWEVARAVRTTFPSTVVGLITGWDAELGPKPAKPVQIDLIVRKPVTQEALRDVVTHARALASVRS